MFQGDQKHSHANGSALDSERPDVPLYPYVSYTGSSGGGKISPKERMAKARMALDQRLSSCENTWINIPLNFVNALESFRQQNLASFVFARRNPKGDGTKGAGLTFYDDLRRLMTFYDVVCQWNKETELVLHSALRDVHVSAQATYQALMRSCLSL